MLTKNTKKIFAVTCILFFAVLFTKIYAIFCPSLLGQIDLSIDEAQYIFWSKNLEMGYFSKPPLIAWMLAFLSQYCGESYQCLRSLQSVAFLFASIFCGASTFVITKDFKISCLSGFLFFTLPLSTFYSQFATTDAWLILFWSAATFFFLKAIKNGSFFWLLCCAGVAGLGLLTKYSMIFFCISALFILQRLNKFSWSQIFIVSCTTFFVFSPNIFWNIANEFPTLKHHVEMTSLDKGVEIHIFPLIEFFLGQLIIFSPLIFFVFFTSLVKKWRLLFFQWSHLNFEKTLLNIKQVWFLTASFSLPIFATMMFLSLISETEINWASPISIPIVIYFCTLVSKAKKVNVISKEITPVVPLTLIINISFFVFFVNSPKFFYSLSSEDTSKYNPFRQVEGYKDLSTRIESLDIGAGKIIASNDRGLLATLSLYLPNYKVRSLNSEGVHNHWDLKYRLSEMEKKEGVLLALLINNDKKTLKNTVKKLKEKFALVKIISLEKEGDLHIQGNRNKKVLLVWVSKEDVV
tara:strand:+ start:11600 stop:13162 length:1563 start_codon:yes stop_codon:yes gene_type:complete